MSLTVSIDVLASGSTPPTKHSTSSGSGSLLIGWPPAIRADQPRGSPSGEDHPLAVPEFLEAVGESIMLHQFGFGVNRDESVSANFLDEHCNAHRENWRRRIHRD